MTDPKFAKSYASFGLRRSFWQVRYALSERKNANENMAKLFNLLRCNEQRIEQKLGRPLENLQILEVGPGQGLERARYLGMKNSVVAVDRDILPTSLDPAGYLRMFRVNGFGRMLKTVGRRLIIGSRNEAAWAKIIHSDKFCDPQIFYGNVCVDPLPQSAYDLVVSWSVFEHLPDPAKALENIIGALKPGGAFFISLHLYTSINGSHDIRAFTGLEDKLPLWGHLRASTSKAIVPSSYLNKWRLKQWRDLFSDMAPGFDEFPEAYDYKDKYGLRLTKPLRDELKDYSDEELFTVDAIYLWQKPLAE